MKILLSVLLISTMMSDINKIARINKIKKEAEKAYKNEEYDKAISAFRLLTDTLGVTEDPVLLNLGNAYFQQKDTTNAAQFYSRVLSSENDVMRSRAYHQMGVINKQKNKLKEAMADFKASLKSNPFNEDARYNYELLKKILDAQEQNQDDNIEPSEYAKKLKAQADKLTGQNLFEQALNLMQMGLKEDKTVAAYNQFITKLNEVVESKE
ncbi:MAG: tetratricopeptide repeat protein [Cytophagales bacterium]|nr:tetratricopeptide repeat protein [Cytophagales bacterium]